MEALRSSPSSIWLENLREPLKSNGTLPPAVYLADLRRIQEERMQSAVDQGAGESGSAVGTCLYPPAYTSSSTCIYLYLTWLHFARPRAISVARISVGERRRGAA